MKYEKSCGAIIFRESEERLFLLLHYPAGHWGAPKGHVEEDEDELETARREVEEETGITDLEFVPGFRKKVQYTYKAGGVQRNKTVIFFLAETSEEEVSLSHEHRGFDWLPLGEALKIITYDDEREVLEAAEKHLESHDSRLNEYF